jgi:hypothetical protein
VHQKQPFAKVAISIFVGLSAFIGFIFIVDLIVVSFWPCPRQLGSTNIPIRENRIKKNTRIG